MSLFELLVEHVGGLLLGATAVLAAGAATVGLARAPIHRQRLAELAIVAALLWLVVAVVPMPRLQPTWRSEVASDLVAVAADRPATRHAPAQLRPPLHENARLPAGRVPIFALGDLLRSAPGLAPSESITVPAPAAPGAPTWDLAQVVIIAYGVGSVLCAGYVLLGYGLLFRILRGARVPRPWLARLVSELTVGVKRRPRVRITARQCRPFCTGVIRPTIVLPESMCHPEMADSLRHVLLHELAHVRQRDGWGHALFALAMPVFYCHPLYWWLRAKAHLSAELVADDLAARQSSRATYVRALIRFSERHHGPALLGVASVQRSPSEFYRRMNMLLKRNESLSTHCSPRRSRAQFGFAIAFVAVTASIWGVPELPAQDPGGGAVRQLSIERAALMGEVEALRDEIGKLRAQLRGAESVVFGRLTEAGDVEPLEPEEFFEEELFEEGSFREEIEEELFEEEAEEEVIQELMFLDAVPLFAGGIAGGGAASRPTSRPSRPALFDEPVAFERLGMDEARAGAAARPPVRFATYNSADDSRYVVELVTRAIDLQGELEIVAHDVERKAALAESKLIGKEDLVVADIRRRTTERKFKAVRRMIDAEFEATALELQDVTTARSGLEADGAKGSRLDQDLSTRMVRLRARLEMLESGR